METKKIRDIIIIHESLLESWGKDIFSFALLALMLVFNFYILHNNYVTDFFLIIFWVMICWSRGLKSAHHFYKKELAIDYINKNYEEEEYEEEERVCEKCGGELSSKMVGDESYDRCSDCGWVTY